MTLYGLYQIYDLVAQTTAGPIIGTTHERAAIRSFTDVLKDNKTAPGQHPEDFQLHEIAKQDPDTGALVEVYNPPRIVFTGKNWLDAINAQSPAPDLSLNGSERSLTGIK